MKSRELAGEQLFARRIVNNGKVNHEMFTDKKAMHFVKERL